MKAEISRRGKRIPVLYTVGRWCYRMIRPAGLSLRRRMPGGLRVTRRGARNKVEYSGHSRIQRTVIVIEGNDNSLFVHDSARLDGCTIRITGNDNSIVIGASSVSGMSVLIAGGLNRIAIDDQCMILSLSLVCEDNGNAISIGERTQIHGATDLAAIEGTRISIGSDCLFSGGIHVRTGDSHSLTDLAGERINPSRDVIIGDHVWLGQYATLLKGSAIPDSSVVGASAVVTKRFESSHVAIGGNPAKVIREGVDWRHERHSQQ